jgi:hypothetical protein
MNHPYTVYFKGKLCVSVLKGSVEILGCTMSARTSARQAVYSPKGSSMLSIETCFFSPSSELDYEVLGENLDHFGLELSEDVMANMRQRDCMIMLEAPRPSPLEGYLKTLPPFMHLFTFTEMKERNARERERSPFYKAEEVLQCVFELPDTAMNLKRHQKGLDWDETASNIVRGM